ncbi:AAA domain-containing protein [Methylobacterium sp. ap11]|uniref:ATP-binding protein n=1 Tax=Methylobacterium sp. ap11 TaxID=1761799 RepID=UPI0008C97827|nr:ATP-binding protein [Methylobacterium sp. ap11]SEP41249.1 AAA domain-containing protein [Methylobacterium sp. ap11]
MSDHVIDPFSHFRSVRSDAQARRTAIMQRVRGTYFRHPKHEEVSEHIDDLIGLMIEVRERQDDPDSAREHEARGIAIIAEPRAGKSTLLRRVFREHPAFPAYGRPNCALVTVTPQGACTLDRFALDTLRKLGMPISEVPRQEIRLAHMIRNQLKLMGVKILHIDEAHHITQPANAVQIKRIINTFKCLMIDDEWPVSLIFSGIPELTAALQKDTQVGERLKFVSLDGLTIDGDAQRMGSIVRRLAQVAELEITPEHIAGITPRLIHAGGYQLGRSIEYVQDAIECCLKRLDRTTSGTVTPSPLLVPEDFARAFARSRGVQADDNPFVVGDWEATDPFRALGTSSTFADDDRGPSSRATAKFKASRKGC